MRPKALKVNRTLTPLETAEPVLPPEVPVDAGPVEVLEVEVEPGAGVEDGVPTWEDRVTPFAELDEMQLKNDDEMLTYH